VRTVPDGLQVRRQIREVLPCRDDALTLTLDVLIDADFDLTDALQRLIPARNCLRSALRSFDIAIYTTSSISEDTPRYSIDSVLRAGIIDG
jgi:hypothetical protein